MKKLLPFLLLLLTLIAPRAASAALVVLADAGHVLSEEAAGRLRTEADHWPFETLVLLEHGTTSAVLEDKAHLSVTAPNVVVFAVDPEGHHVVTRFGTGSGVKPADYDAIGKAGYANFREGAWADGLIAMGTRARASAESATSLNAATEPVVVQAGMTTTEWVLLGILALVVLWFVAVIVRSFRKSEAKFERALDDNRLETGELRSRNIREAAWAETIEKTTAATPRVVTLRQEDPGNDNFTTGLVIGEALGRQERRSSAPPPAPAPHVVSSSHHASPSASSSNDGGGTSGGFDLFSGGFGGDSGSSGDFGGGGGFDGGGSSGDF